MSFVIDTDICSAHLKGNSLVTGRFLLHTGGLYISVVTMGELFTWTLRAKTAPKRLHDLLTFLQDVHILETTSAVARRFGEVRASLMDQGIRVPDMDLWIGATALFHGFTLVTHNTSDFANIPGLNVVDWMIP